MAKNQQFLQIYIIKGGLRSFTGFWMWSWTLEKKLSKLKHLYWLRAPETAPFNTCINSVSKIRIQTVSEYNTFILRSESPRVVAAVLRAALRFALWWKYKCSSWRWLQKVAKYLTSFEASLQTRARRWAAQATATIRGKLSLSCLATPFMCPVVTCQKTKANIFFKKFFHGTIKYYTCHNCCPIWAKPTEFFRWHLFFFFAGHLLQQLQRCQLCQHWQPQCPGTN